MQDDWDTRERLMTTAERLYAEHGIEGMSLRGLTQEAGVNLAAVNYHFGGKLELMIEVFRRHIDPINDERIAMLDAARELSGDAPLTLEEIFDALLVPMARRALTSNAGREAFIKSMGRIHVESRELFRMTFEQFFANTIRRFVEELSRAMPELPTTEIATRLHFSVNAMLGTFMRHHIMAELGALPSGDEGLWQMIRQLRDFICAGFRAPLNVEQEVAK